MPTTTRASSTSSTSTTSAASMATVLKAQLESSASATIYVPLEGGDAPSDDELKALMADGVHAELDVVRGALAVRKATDDEIAEASAPAEPVAVSAPSSSSSSSST